MIGEKILTNSGYMGPSVGSLFFVRTVDVVHTDVVGNASLTLAFLRGIGLGVARLWSGEGYLTG
jgi:hypothetical protein